MWHAVLGLVVAWVLAGITVYFFSPVNGIRLPRLVWIMDGLLALALITGVRLLARTIFERPAAGGGLVARGKEVLIVGAGSAGQLTADEMRRNPALGYTPIGYVDDAPRHRGRRVRGIRVLGTTDDLRHVLRNNRPDEVLIAIPRASGEVRQRI